MDQAKLLPPTYPHPPTGTHTHTDTQTHRHRRQLGPQCSAKESRTLHTRLSVGYQDTRREFSFDIFQCGASKDTVMKLYVYAVVLVCHITSVGFTIDLKSVHLNSKYAHMPCDCILM